MGYLYYSELGNSAGGPLSNTVRFEHLLPTPEWSWTAYAAVPISAWRFDLLNGQQSGGNNNGQIALHAIAVRRGDVAGVPERATTLLLGSGVVGLLVGRRVFKRIDG